MSTHTAYTAVAARKSLNRPAMQSHTPNGKMAASNESQTTTKTKKIDWPMGVRLYVQRSFVPENNIPGIEKTDMEKKLKEVITQAAEHDTLNSIDWDTLPLPQQMIQSERAKLASSSAAPHWSQSFSALFVKDSEKEKTSKKRKSAETTTLPVAQESLPPWRKTNARNNAFEDRISHPKVPSVDRGDKRQRKFEEDFSRNDPSKSDINLEKRRRRFEGVRLGAEYTRASSREDSATSEGEAGPVVGRCQQLEKKYFRLTAAPNPDSVRPLDVLERTLEMLKRKWRKENNYSYICDQFKSLRQDLTVQHIKNEFTVKVYEIHARIALEKGDIGEYNQCQTQLRGLYAQNLGGNPVEFKAYRILYFIHTCNRTDMNEVLADLTATEKQQPAIKHALDVRSALALGNYHRFFQLYLNTPNMGAYLMDMFIVRERLLALANICKAYRPDVKLRFITEELGFESDGETVQFFVEHDAQHLLEEREDGVRLLTGKAGALFEVAKSVAFKRVDIKGQI
ncbi:GANP domain-containing protein [Xylona heveae TC161]|uniref:GANP domain-containing protein n=1 Tax=Xylona heveae (strain CBS 132557 / TC161) TaxID=1328760 RepID=A0A165IWU9_XYLHT|nr:GANP domain-containing protein [Xylona heveae TC161]KZF25485.1 GANP domain-containing protein [Xylona heveae TC161]